MTDKREKMLELIPQYGITVLAPSDDALRLADIYIAEGVIPLKYRTDGVHIAVASVNDMDMIISLNFQHIVKLKTKRLTAEINRRYGFSAVEICIPMEVIDNENS